MLYKDQLYLDSQLVSSDTYNQIEGISLRLEKSFSKVALTYAFVSRLAYKNVLLSKGVSFFEFDYDKLPDFKEDISKAEFDFLINHNIFPYFDADNKCCIVAADPTDFVSNSKFEEIFLCKVHKQAIAEDLDIIKALHIKFGQPYLHKAVFSLYEKDSKSSAIETFSFNQVISIGVIGFFFLVSLFFYPIYTLILINLLINLFLFLAIGFKLLLTIGGAKSEKAKKITKAEISSLKDKDLPVYTIQLPVFKESEVIYKLAFNLQSLDYPKEKLDVKLLIEADDLVTFNAIKNLKFPCIFDPVIIPTGQPKTKPKACNYGLFFSRGKYLTIYDAEDIPDSNQLKKVLLLFEKLPEEYIVVQCALNYFNKTENYLTRMFTLEYSYWFDYMLPGLDNLKVPIPLGGTSNHFKFDKLIELGGWDGFNVTEDADLGLRAYAKGYKVTVLDSTTYEEANNEFYNWIRQRSRWIKGYMQTYLVHMRSPVKLIKKIGWKGFFGFQFFIGGTFFTFLLYPILLLFFVLYFVLMSDFMNNLIGHSNYESFKSYFHILFPDWLIIISVFNFFVGNLMMIYVNMIAVFRRRTYNLILYAITNPVYWLMHSISAYKGLFQLISKPFYWEKTNHGLTKNHK